MLSKGTANSFIISKCILVYFCMTLCINKMIMWELNLHYFTLYSTPSVTLGQIAVSSVPRSLVRHTDPTLSCDFRKNLPNYFTGIVLFYYSNLAFQHSLSHAWKPDEVVHMFSIWLPGLSIDYHCDAPDFYDGLVWILYNGHSVIILHGYLSKLVV